MLVFLHIMPIKTLTITLDEAFMLSGHVKHFIFHANEIPPFDYLPGQFITIHFEHEGKTLRRSYSIANVPMQDNRIEFAAGYVEGGPGTNLLFNLAPGDTIQISGPFGRLVLKETIPKRYIFVATSTGITPYRAMLPELIRRMQAHPDLQLIILQGVQKKEDILYSNEFLELASKHPNVLFQAHLSREKKALLSDHEHPGYVQHAFETLNLNPEEDLVYLCGNPGMIDESFAYLQAKHFTTATIIREKYISGKS